MRTRIKESQPVATGWGFSAVSKVYQKLVIKGRLALLVEASNLPPATEARILPPLSI
jgi:hypothetical protein